MITFFVALALLIIGFFTYSRLVEKVFRIDDRQTPPSPIPTAWTFVPMKTWRIFLGPATEHCWFGPHLWRTGRCMLGASGLPVDRFWYYFGRRCP